MESEYGDTVGSEYGSVEGIPKEDGAQAGDTMSDTAAADCRRSERKRRDRRPFFSPDDFGKMALPSTSGVCASPKKKRKLMKRSIPSASAADRPFDILPDGTPFSCDLCQSPYVCNPLLSKAGSRVKRSRHMPSPQQKLNPVTGKLLTLCNACGHSLDRPRPSKTKVQPSQEEKEAFLAESRAFASSLAAQLQDPDAERLYCPSYQSTSCGCLQNYIGANGDEEAMLERARELLALHKEAKKLSAEKVYSLDKMEARSPEKKRTKSGSIGLGNGMKRSRRFEAFILEKRVGLKRDLQLCERAAQRVLCYSNNFLHKKLKTEERGSRVVRQKGKAALGLLEPLDKVAARHCCVDKCVRMVHSHRNLLQQWRKRAMTSQTEARRVLAEMLTPSGGVRSNCYKFISWVTGCSNSTIGKVRDQMRRTKGDREPPLHGLYSYWQQKGHNQSKGSTPSATVTHDEVDNGDSSSFSLSEGVLGPSVQVPGSGQPAIAAFGAASVTTQHTAQSTTTTTTGNNQQQLMQLQQQLVQQQAAISHQQQQVQQQMLTHSNMQQLSWSHNASSLASIQQQLLMQMSQLQTAQQQLAQTIQTLQQQLALVQTAHPHLALVPTSHPQPDMAVPQFVPQHQQLGTHPQQFMLTQPQQQFAAAEPQQFQPTQTIQQQQQQALTVPAMPQQFVPTQQQFLAAQPLQRQQPPPQLLSAQPLQQHQQQFLTMHQQQFNMMQPAQQQMTWVPQQQVTVMPGQPQQENQTWPSATPLTVAHPSAPGMALHQQFQPQQPTVQQRMVPIHQPLSEAQAGQQAGAEQIGQQQGITVHQNAGPTQPLEQQVLVTLFPQPHQQQQLQLQGLSTSSVMQQNLSQQQQQQALSESGSLNQQQSQLTEFSNRPVMSVAPLSQQQTSGTVVLGSQSLPLTQNSLALPMTQSDQPLPSTQSNQLLPLTVTQSRYLSFSSQSLPVIPGSQSGPVIFSSQSLPLIQSSQSRPSAQIGHQSAAATQLLSSDMNNRQVGIPLGNTTQSSVGGCSTSSAQTGNPQKEAGKSQPSLGVPSRSHPQTVPPNKHHSSTKHGSHHQSGPMTVKRLLQQRASAAEGALAQTDASHGKQSQFVAPAQLITAPVTITQADSVSMAKRHNDVDSGSHQFEDGMESVEEQQTSPQLIATRRVSSSGGNSQRVGQSTVLGVTGKSSPTKPLSQTIHASPPSAVTASSSPEMLGTTLSPVVSMALTAPSVSISISPSRQANVKDTISVAVPKQLVITLPLRRQLLLSGPRPNGGGPVLTAGSGINLLAGGPRLTLRPTAPPTPLVHKQPVPQVSPQTTTTTSIPLTVLQHTAPRPRLNTAHAAIPVVVSQSPGGPLSITLTSSTVQDQLQDTVQGTVPDILQGQGHSMAQEPATSIVQGQVPGSVGAQGHGQLSVSVQGQGTVQGKTHGSIQKTPRKMATASATTSGGVSAVGTRSVAGSIPLASSSATLLFLPGPPVSTPVSIQQVPVTCSATSSWCSSPVTSSVTVTDESDILRTNKPTGALSESATTASLRTAPTLITSSADTHVIGQVRVVSETKQGKQAMGKEEDAHHLSQALPVASSTTHVDVDLVHPVATPRSVAATSPKKGKTKAKKVSKANAVNATVQTVPPSVQTLPVSVQRVAPNAALASSSRQHPNSSISPGMMTSSAATGSAVMPIPAEASKQPVKAQPLTTPVTGLVRRTLSSSTGSAPAVLSQNQTVSASKPSRPLSTNAPLPSSSLPVTVPTPSTAHPRGQYIPSTSITSPASGDLAGPSQSKVTLPAHMTDIAVLASQLTAESRHEASVGASTTYFTRGHADSVIYSGMVCGGDGMTESLAQVPVSGEQCNVRMGKISHSFDVRNEPRVTTAVSPVRPVGSSLQSEVTGGKHTMQASAAATALPLQGHRETEIHRDAASFRHSAASTRTVKAVPGKTAVADKNKSCDGVRVVRPTVSDTGVALATSPSEMPFASNSTPVSLQSVASTGFTTTLVSQAELGFPVSFTPVVDANKQMVCITSPMNLQQLQALLTHLQVPPGAGVVQISSPPASQPGSTSDITFTPVRSVPSIVSQPTTVSMPSGEETEVSLTKSSTHSLPVSVSSPSIVSMIAVPPRPGVSAASNVSAIVSTRPVEDSSVSVNASVVPVTLQTGRASRVTGVYSASQTLLPATSAVSNARNLEGGSENVSLHGSGDNVSQVAAGSNIAAGRKGSRNDTEGQTAKKSASSKRTEPKTKPQKVMGTTASGTQRGRSSHFETTTARSDASTSTVPPDMTHSGVGPPSAQSGFQTQFSSSAEKSSPPRSSYPIMSDGLSYHSHWQTPTTVPRDVYLSDCHSPTLLEMRPMQPLVPTSPHQPPSQAPSIGNVLLLGPRPSPVFDSRPMGIFSTQADRFLTSSPSPVLEFDGDDVDLLSVPGLHHIISSSSSRSRNSSGASSIEPSITIDPASLPFDLMQMVHQGLALTVTEVTPATSTDGDTV